jgi:hypothetical protein
VLGFVEARVTLATQEWPGLYQSGDDRGGGIRVTEQGMPSAALEPAAPGVVAFVGRTLRGPVDQPVVVRSFGDFERLFGGLWQPSPLAYALSQFFGNGGREAVVVRVANAARSATVLLPTGVSSPVTPAASALPGGWRLAARQPGTREFLRAAVDYDGLGPDETDEFNLLLQRVRTAGSEVVEVQECGAGNASVSVQLARGFRAGGLPTGGPGPAATGDASPAVAVERPGWP